MSKPIKYHRVKTTAVGGGADTYLSSAISGPFRLRVANLNDDTTQIEVLLQVCEANQPGDSTMIGISLIHNEMMRGVGYDVSWQGDIIVPLGWIVKAKFLQPTAGDTCYLTIGYEEL